MSLFMQDKFHSMVNRLFEKVPEDTKHNVIDQIKTIISSNETALNEIEHGTYLPNNIKKVGKNLVAYVSTVKVEDYADLIRVVSGLMELLPEAVQQALYELNNQYKPSVESSVTPLIRGDIKQSSAVKDPGGAGGGVGLGGHSDSHVSGLKSSSSHSSEMPEGVIDEVRINALKAEIIDGAIAKFKLRKTALVPFSQTYDLRDNKKGDRLTGSDAKSGMRNKIYDQLMYKLEEGVGLKEYLEADKAKLINIIDNFIFDQANSLTPKQTSCGLKELEPFFNNVIAVRRGIYSVPEMRGLLEKDLSVGKMKMAHEDFGALITGLPTWYRKEHGAKIITSIEKITERTSKGTIEKEIYDDFRCALSAHKNTAGLADRMRDGIDHLADVKDPEMAAPVISDPAKGREFYRLQTFIYLKTNEHQRNPG